MRQEWVAGDKVQKMRPGEQEKKNEGEEWNVAGSETAEANTSGPWLSLFGH